MSDDSINDPVIPYRLSDHDRGIRVESSLELYGKLSIGAISLSGVAVALIIAFGTHLL